MARTGKRGRKKGSPQTKGPTCGAKTRSGEPCKAAAGWKTKHPGEGRCHFHGGKFKLKTGTRTKLRNPANIARVGVENLRALALVVTNTDSGKAIAQEDIEAEIRTLRTIKAAQEIELFYELGKTGELKPISEADILKKIREGNGVVADLVEVTDKIGALLAKKARIRFHEAAFTAEDVTRLIMKIGRIIQKYVPESDDQEALWSEIEALAILGGHKGHDGSDE